MAERLVTFVQLRGDATFAAGLTAVALVQIVLLDESASVPKTQPRTRSKPNRDLSSTVSSHHHRHRQ